MVGIGLKIKIFLPYYLLALSTHKNVKCYPTMTKSLQRVIMSGLEQRQMASSTPRHGVFGVKKGFSG